MPKGVKRNVKSPVESYSESHKVHVDLGPRSYDILIEPGILEKVGQEISSRLTDGKTEGRTVVLLTNPKVDLYHGTPVNTSLEQAGFRVLPISIPSGECYKTLQTVRRIYRTLHAAAVDRRTIFVAMGGGVIGDVGGFVAATYNRGLDFVQVPTTLLAQVDSSVGGKTGVNFDSGKNLVGAFYQPKLVVIDTNTLKSLPLRERRSGLVEMVKYGIIYDPGFFDLMVREIPNLLRLKSEALSYCIARSCEIKARVVEKDERDDGIRAILNFGHTIGHALEAITRYRVYRHGEAIAVGMVSACLIGEELGLTAPEDTLRIVTLFQSAGFPVAMHPNIAIGGVMRLLSWDKKAVDGAARFVLMERIGTVSHGHIVHSDVIRTALERQRAELSSLEA